MGDQIQLPARGTTGNSHGDSDNGGDGDGNSRVQSTPNCTSCNDSGDGYDGSILEMFYGWAHAAGEVRDHFISVYQLVSIDQFILFDWVLHSKLNLIN